MKLLILLLGFLLLMLFSCKKEEAVMMDEGIRKEYEGYASAIMNGVSVDMKATAGRYTGSNGYEMGIRYSEGLWTRLFISISSIKLTPGTYYPPDYWLLNDPFVFCHTADWMLSDGDVAGAIYRPEADSSFVLHIDAIERFPKIGTSNGSISGVMKGRFECAYIKYEDFSPDGISGGPDTIRITDGKFTALINEW